jgi:putative phage-type endonuclease
MMEILNLVQGSPEWHKHRANTLNASDAPAMMGLSKYKSRDKLLREMAFGEASEIYQKIADNGHKFEELARPLAMKRIGSELYRVTGITTDYGLPLPLGASFDGLPMAEDIPFEHKSMNDDLRACTCAADLNIMYRIQMEQQLMVCGGEEVLFMATRWNGNDEIEESKEFWYEPDPVLRQAIYSGWEQFCRDLEALKASGPAEVKEKVVAEEIEQVPTLFVQAEGRLTANNLEEFQKKTTLFLSSLNTKPETDQEFATAETAAKSCREAVTRIEAIKTGMLAQTVTIGEAVSTMDALKEKYRLMALQLEKAVKDEKEGRRVAILQKARSDYAKIVSDLEVEIKPIRITIPEPDFVGAMKNKRTIEGWQGGINDCMATATIAANAAAKDCRAKLQWCKDNAEGRGGLFPDLQTLMAKPMEDFTMTIKSRIADDDARKEDEIKRIRAEEEEKARKAVEAQNINPALNVSCTTGTIPKGAVIESGDIHPMHGNSKEQSEFVEQKRPSRIDLIDTIAGKYNVSISVARDWLIAEFKAG